MQKIFSLVIFFGLLLSSTAATAGDLESFWAKSEFTIDGQLDEWGDYALNHFEDEKFSVGIRNDSNYVYVIFVTRDQYMVRMAQMSGLKIWLNGKGKKDKNFGILYHPDYGQDTLLFKAPIRGGAIAVENLDKTGPNQTKFLGKKFIIEKDGRRYDDDSRLHYATINSAIYKGVYLIEMRFKLSGNELLDDYFSAKPKDKVALCFELGGDNLRGQMKANREGMGGPPGGMRGGGDDFGGGGRPSGGGKGGRGGMGGGQRPEMVKVEKWIKIKLSDIK